MGRLLEKTDFENINILLELKVFERGQGLSGIKIAELHHCTKNLGKVTLIIMINDGN